MKSQSITLTNFGEVLDESLLAKGYDYIEHVSDLKSTRDDHYEQWQAKVTGKTTYRVVLRIERSSGSVMLNSCTCPVDEPFCKHQVAVLYSIDMEESTEPKKGKVATDKVGDLLAKVTVDELKGYIQSLTEADDKVKKHFLSFFAVKNSQTVAEFKKIIEQSLSPLKRRHGFVHYQVFLQAVKPIEALVNSARHCVDAGDFQTGINIYMAVLDKLIPALRTIDDSNGILSTIVNDAFLELHLLNEDKQLPHTITAEVLKYALRKSVAADVRGFDHEWKMAELAVEYATLEDESQIQKMITTLKLAEKGDAYSEKYSAERAAYTLLLFFFNHKSIGEIEAFLDENLKFQSIRKVAIDHAVRAKQFDKALTLIQDGIHQAEQEKHPGTVSELRRAMLNVYIQQDDTQNVISTAELLFFQPHSDLTSYRILRKYLNHDQWLAMGSEYRRKLEKYSDYGALAEVLNEENMPEELLRVLTVANNVTLVQKYEPHIPQQFKSRLQKIYFSLITSSLALKADRASYRFNARLLKSMLGKYDDAATIRFANGLRDQYKQRKALIEELVVIPTA